MKTGTASEKVDSQRATGGSSALDAYLQRARELANRHPAGGVVAAAGAGVLYAAELTIGALDGMGVARPFRNKTAFELLAELKRHREELLGQTQAPRERLRQQGERLRQQGEKLLEKGRAQGEQLLRRGRALWPFPRREPPPSKPVAQA